VLPRKAQDISDESAGERQIANGRKTNNIQFQADHVRINYFIEFPKLLGQHQTS